MASPPPQEVIDAIEEGVTEVTRRIEVCEADGETLWFADFADDPETSRLVTGSVNIDYNSDERRKGDVVLRNDDLAFRLNPRGGFYYDKVIKLYRGVTYSSTLGVVRAALIDFDLTALDLQIFMRTMSNMGIQMDDLTLADPSDYEKYTILITYTTTRVTNKSAYLKDAYTRGKKILTLGHKNTSAEIPLWSSGFNEGSGVFAMVKVGNRDHPIAGSDPFNTTYGTGMTGWKPTVAAAGTLVMANEGSVFPAGGYWSAGYGVSRTGGEWMDYRVAGSPIVGATAIAVKAGVDYLRGSVETSRSWESQIGEFMIDGANDQIFPKQIKLTLRDYTKKLLKDKLEFTSTFVAGTKLYTFIRAIAANGGVYKLRLSIGDEALPYDMSFERGTERWKMIKDACTAFNYECFFDNEGYLVVRPFLDPTLSPISFSIAYGRNLVNYDRAINDGRIHNIARVYGEPPPGVTGSFGFYGVASNDDPNSPTSTVRLGRRPWEFSANYFTSDDQCRHVALSRLSILGLESYEVNYASLYYPWMEAGEIIEIIDPDALQHEPTRFLNDTITMPLDLGPMSGTAKRVTRVGDPGTGTSGGV